jgi:diguanylate cyclase (GGDEF)-like protein
MLHWVNRQLSALPKWMIISGTLGIVFTLVAIDVVTEPFVSFVLFYGLAIGVCAWYASPRWAHIAGLIAASSWLEGISIAGQHPLLSLWNALIRVGAVFLFLRLLATFRTSLDRATYLATHDPLTSALNVRAFRDRLATVQQQARLSASPLTLAYLDLDNFKAVNDRHGHSTGDTLLTRLVNTVQANLRPGDAIARLGGDEFVLMLPEVDTVTAASMCALLVAQAEHTLQANNWPVTLSMGVVTFLTIPDTIDDMLRVTDELMYTVKHAGKNSVRYATFATHQQAPRQSDNAILRYREAPRGER